MVLTGILTWCGLLAYFGWSFGVVFSGLCLLVLLALLGSYQWEHQYHWLKPLRRAGYLLLALWLLSVLLVLRLIANQTEQLLPQTGYVVVLGAGLKQGDQLSRILKSRLDRALDLVRAQPSLRLVVSGGQGPDENLSEAAAMQQYLLAHGLANESIILENQSHTTSENLQFSRRLLAAVAQQTAVIVTSDFHLYRTQHLAKTQGWQVGGIKAPTPFWLWLNYALREYFALVQQVWSWGADHQ